MSWLTTFVVVMVFASAIAITALWVRLGTAESQLSAQIALLEDEVSANGSPSSKDEQFIDYYRDVNTKMDQAIDRIITVFEITVTVLLVFGFLLAYRAPRDVERELERLRSETESAKESAEEARYQALICIAESSDSPHDKIRRYDELIAKYPARPDAYNARGWAHDDMGEYDLAIRDYESAHDRGGEEGVYLNNVAVAHAKAGHFKLAASFYGKAIEMSPSDALLYDNRAVVRGDLGDYEGALSDFEVALTLDPRNPTMLVNRALTYQELAGESGDSGKRRTYLTNAVDDLVKARELAPKDERTSDLLKDALGQLQDMGPDPEEVTRVVKQVARIERGLADKALESNDLLAALKHFGTSIEMQVLAKFDGGNKVDVEAVSHEMRNSPTAMEAIGAVINHEAIRNTSEMALSPLLAGLFMNAGFDAYQGGEWLHAERLFSLVAHSQNSSRSMALTNLAYMKRRGETSETPEEAIDLLDLCSEQRNGVWTMNMALCYADGVGVEQDVQKFVELIRGDATGVADSYSWWSQVDVVGAKESNIALLGLALAGFTGLGDGVSIEARIERALDDGYPVKAALEQVARTPTNE